MKFFAVFALLACCAFAQEGPQCAAPNGGGLQPVLQEFTAMVPVEKVLEILLTAMTSDPETQAVMEYLSSPDFHQVVDVVQAQPSFRSLMGFACDDLYLDAKYYFNMLAGIFGFAEVHSQQMRHPRVMRTTGFRAVLLEILDLIPTEEAQALFEQKLASDYYLQLAMQKINSDEFGSIIETLQSNAAYNDMKNRLSALGVDVGGIIESITKIFKPQAI